MKQTTIGGNKRKLMNGLAVALLVVIFIAYMFPFLMVVINSLKQKRDIIKSPFSWLFTIKGLSFDNFVKAFTQMDFLNAFKNSLFVTVSATVLVTLLAAMLAYYIVRNKNKLSDLTFALMVASMIIPFQAIMIPLVSIYGSSLHVLNHRLTLIFMHTGFSMAMSVFMFHGFIKGNIPIALEEAAVIDGASTWQQIKYVTLPCLKTTIITLVIMAIGRMFYSDFGLFYQVPMNNGMLFDVTNTIDTYVYRGLLQLNDVGRSSAAGFLQSLLGFTLVMITNVITRKVDPDSALF